MSIENPDFFKAQYQDLHASKEAERAAVDTQLNTGEQVGQNPADRIQNYSILLFARLPAVGRNKKIH